MKRRIAAFLVLLVAIASLPAQTAPNAQSPDPNQEGEGKGNKVEDYEPYTEAEFPQWLLDLRRAEVVFLGSFPITMLLSTLSYDGYRSLTSALATDTAQTAGADAGSYTPAESTGLLLAGLSLSAVVAILDFVFGQLERSKSE